MSEGLEGLLHVVERQRPNRVDRHPERRPEQVFDRLEKATR